MRLVITEDDKGYLHRMMITDSMEEKDAHMGLLDDPPNLDELDWMQIKKELHNLLVKRAIISIDSSAELKNLSNTIVSVVQPKIVALLRQKKVFTNGGKK